MTIVTTDKPKSFDEVFDQDDNLLHNSNMLNLVSASKQIRESLIDLKAEIARLETLDVEIKAFASGPKENLQNTTEVDRLFKLVNNAVKAEKRRW